MGHSKGGSFLRSTGPHGSLGGIQLRSIRDGTKVVGAMAEHEKSGLQAW